MEVDNTPSDKSSPGCLHLCSAGAHLAQEGANFVDLAEVIASDNAADGDASESEWDMLSRGASEWELVSEDSSETGPI